MSCPGRSATMVARRNCGAAGRRQRPRFGIGKAGGVRGCGHIAIYRSPAYVFIIAMPLRRWIPACAGIQRRNFLLR